MASLYSHGSVAVSVVLGALCLGGCHSGGDNPSPAASAQTTAALPPSSAPSTTATAVPSAPASESAPASASANATSRTIAALRADAQRDPGSFTGKPVSFEGYFVAYSQTGFGEGEHPYHAMSVVRFSLAGDASDASDPLECRFREGRWPPPSLKPGEAVTVRGTWSFDRMRSGGIVDTGGPLHLVECQVTRAGTPPAP